MVQFSMVRGPASDGKGQTLDEGVDVVQLPRMNRRGAATGNEQTWCIWWVGLETRRGAALKEKKTCAANTNRQEQKWCI